MNTLFSRYFLYYPITALKGEFVALHLNRYRKSQYYTPSVILANQENHAKKLIRHAKLCSPYYKNRLPEISWSGLSTEKFWEVFQEIPLLTKQDLILHGANIQSKRSRFLFSKKTTGGSTGEPVTILKNANALARERAATWRAYEWAGIVVGDPQGRFWGVPHNLIQRKKASIADVFANRIRISAFNISEATLMEYYNKIKLFRPKYLYGYVSAIEEFANFIIEMELPPLPSLVSIITTSEVLTDSRREKIQTAFAVRVFNEYGCGEVGSIAHECEEGSLHLMAENLIIEILSGQDTGELVVTDLFNYAMPLIRYSLGDFASIDHKKCLCGKSLPVIKGIHGRAYDLLVTRNGRKIHPEAIMYIFENLQQKHKAFKQFRVIQKSEEIINVEIVPEAAWSDDIKGQVEAELKYVIGESVNVDILLVQEISREKSGKMRVVKSELNNHRLKAGGFE
jgi:phenylacetate-CoA ligase